MNVFSCHRHNELWGKKAPSRHLNWRRKLNRSFSDPNISQSVELYNFHSHQNDSIDEDDDLPFMPEDDEFPTSPLQPTLFHYSTLPPSTLHVDKSENIRNYLASLPNLLLMDDDQGIGGENVCTSESGSGYSSPILTPPDEEQFHSLYRLAKEVRKDMRQRLASEDLESNSPTEDERAAENPTVSTTAGVAGVVTTTSITTNSATTIVTAQPLPRNVAQKPRPSEQSRGLESSGRTSKGTSPSPPPVTFSIGPSRSQTESRCDYNPCQLVKTVRSASLPHNIVPTTALSPWKPSLSPNSSAIGLTGLPRNGSGLQQLVEEASLRGAMPRSDQASPLPAECLSPLLPEYEEVAQFDSRSESPIAALLPLSERLQQHRRTKSDTCDLSGPVKTAQINSVPERIKEIEERNEQAATPQTQGLEREPGNPKDTSVAPSIKHSPNPPPIKHSSMSSAQSSSMESLPSDDEVIQEEQCSPFKSSPSPRGATRHSSLSPRPPSTRLLPPHLVLQSSLSLPHNIQPLDIESDDISMSSEMRSDEDIAISLQGAVKARVQDFEGMSKEEQLGSQKPSTENLSRRSSPSNQRRPSSDMLIHRPSSNAELKRLRTSPEKSEHVFRKPSRLTHRRPSSDVVMSSRPRSVMAGDGMSSLETSSGKFMSVEDLPSQLGSVQELKRKFEDTQSTDSGERPAARFRVNLRRAQSLRDFDGLRTKYTKRKQVSSSRLGKMVSSRRSSAAALPPEYITTIPTMTLPRDVDDFQTTLTKFSMMAGMQ